MPINILQNGLLPETIQGSKGAFKNKRGKNMVILGRWCDQSGRRMTAVQLDEDGLLD